MSSEIERLRNGAEQDPAQLIRLADTLVAAGNAGEAVVVCRRGHAAWPSDVNVTLALGRALSAAGHLEEANAVLLAAMSSKSAAPATERPPPAPKAKAGDEASFADLAFEEVTVRRDSTETNFEVLVDEPATRPGGRGVVGQATTKARALSTPPRGEPQPAPVRGEPQRPREPQMPRGEPRPAAAPPHAEPRPARPAAQQPQAPINLDAVAQALLASAPIDADRALAPTPEDSHQQDMSRRWQARRRNSFIWLWAGLVLVAAGSVAGYLYHLKAEAKELGELVTQGDAALGKASPEGDAQARDAFARAVRIRPRDPRYSTMLAFAAARLHADQGEDTDAAAWAMMRRSEKEAKKNADALDARAVADSRRARALLALARGEPCPAAEPEDGDIAARCAVQKGDLDGARKMLAATIANGGDAANIRALLVLGSLELGAGDLDAADGALRRVLAVAPDNPRAKVGRDVVAIEHGDSPIVELPAVRLGVTTEAWYHLARGLVAINRGKGGDAQTALSELDLARRGIVHEGRLALLYARARLMLGQVSEAEQAMRVAERLDPNDVDVGVLDAEVALAKGYEDKVASALSVGPQTPRRLAVYGRALELIGKHKEAVSALDTALARRPGDATTITYRAIARAHLGETAAAMRELEKAAAQLSSPTPHFGLGLLAYEKKDLNRARVELEKATERNTEAFRSRALLGRVLRDLGKTKEALVELERAARESPNLLSVHSALGRMYLDLGRYREARAEMRIVLDGGKPTVDDRMVYAEATLAMGLVEDGEAVLGEATGAPPAKVARLKLVAQSWKGPKEAAAAVKVLEKENKTAQGRDTRLVFQLADALRRSGDPKRATMLLSGVIGADGLHANLGLGRLALAQGDPAGAETAYRAALAAWTTAPYGVDDRTEARVGLGRALLARKAVTDAVTMLLSATADDPQAPEARYWLARAYQDQNDKEKARVQATRATELDDHYGEAYVLLGDLWKSDNKDKARTAYKKYLEVSPDGASAKQVKKNLASLR